MGEALRPHVLPAPIAPRGRYQSSPSSRSGEMTQGTNDPAFIDASAWACSHSNCISTLVERRRSQLICRRICVPPVQKMSGRRCVRFETTRSSTFAKPLLAGTPLSSCASLHKAVIALSPMFIGMTTLVPSETTRSLLAQSRALFAQREGTKPCEPLLRLIRDW